MAEKHHRDSAMTMTGSRTALDQRDSKVYRFTAKEKDNMRRDTRSAWRAFMKETFGDHSLGIAMIRYGCRSTSEMQEMAQAIDRAKVQRCEPPAGAHDPQQKAAAYKARADFKWGHRVAQAIDVGRRRYDELSEHEKGVHSLYHRGQLKKAVREANKRAGQRSEATRANSAEQRAMKQFRVTHCV